jgi:hypothetical protein
VNFKNCKTVYDTLTGRSVIIERDETLDFHDRSGSVTELRCGDIASSQANAVNIYDQNTFEMKQQIQFSQDVWKVVELRYSRIAAACKNGVLCIYDLTLNTLILEKRYEMNELSAIIELRDGTIALGGDRETILVIDAQTGEILRELPCSNAITMTEIRPWVLLVACMEDNVARLLNAQTGSVLHTYSVCHYNIIILLFNREIIERCFMLYTFKMG